MRRLLRDAVLIAATAACVWFVRGEAQEDYTVVYGVPMQIICLEGAIENMMVSESGLDRVSIMWRQWAGPTSLRGSANLKDCVLYPDLQTPTS